MPEARDRLVRPNDVAETYRARLTSVGRTRIRPDEIGDENRAPFRWGSTSLTGGGLGQHNGGVAHLTRGRGIFGSPVVNRHNGGQRQNTPPSRNVSRRGRGANSWANGVLPSWYPRRPLADITHIDRAIQKRRERLGNGNGQVLETPAPTRIYRQQPADQDPSPSGARLEQELFLVTPKPNIASKTFKSSNLGKVPMIFADFANQGGGESEFLTPAKRLLNSIDIVEKVVMEELARSKRTPAAKKAEREKKVRILMSMR
uniref:protein POLYCHOME-like n=1 Tax=Erigeron canadensis TaxID=72917 RepID=UPI001CB95268|nr:protein POLYCHOME-like [Erigeron canadensis]XP_043611358.1 protein POLYCHOME-like [Erigeron canadensis]